MTLPLLLLWPELSDTFLSFPSGKEAWRWIPSSKHSTSTHGSIYEGKRRDWILGESASRLQHRAGAPFVQRFSLSLKSPQKVNRDRICIFLLNALRLNCETVSRILPKADPCCPTHPETVFLPHAAGAASAAQGGARESAWALYPVPCPWMWPLGLHLLSSCVPYSCAKCSLQNPPGPLPAGLPLIPPPHTLPRSLQCWPPCCSADMPGSDALVPLHKLFLLPVGCLLLSCLAEELLLLDSPPHPIALRGPASIISPATLRCVVHFCICRTRFRAPKD